jgi:hypothetical protein
VDDAAKALHRRLLFKTTKIAFGLGILDELVDTSQSGWQEES